MGKGTGLVMVAALTVVAALRVVAALTVVTVLTTALVTTPAPGIAAAQPAPAAQSVSPRALGNQTTTATSAANDVNPVIECHKMIASPKAIQACADHPTAMSGCCKTATAR